MAQWQLLQQPKNSAVRIESVLSGGIYTGADSFDIQENQSVNEYGWDTDENYPALVTAKAPTVYGASGSAITRLLTNFGNTQLVRVVGNTLQYNSSGTWMNISGSFANIDWSASNFDVNGPALIMTNGTDAVQYWNGSALAPLSANAPKGRYITADNLRVFIANVATDQTQDVIHYCAFQDAKNWTTPENSGSVQYYTPNGGAITAIITFAGQIWIFKKDSFALIYHTGDSRAAYRLVPSSDNIGCINAKTLVEVGESLYWLGMKDIYIGSAGAASRIGEPVRTFINRINQAYIDKCSAFTDGIRYYLNLVLDSATEPNYRLMYDPRYRIWHVAGINEQYRYGILFNGTAYAGNTSGQTYSINTATTSGAWMIETKDFDRSEAEKEYNELHVQMHVPSGTTVKYEVSVDQGATWYSLGNSATTAGAAQNQNIIIPLNVVPLGYWARFRFSGTGPYKLYGFQRYFNVMPVMH